MHFFTPELIGDLLDCKLGLLVVLVLADASHQVDREVVANDPLDSVTKGGISVQNLAVVRAEWRAGVINRGRRQETTINFVAFTISGKDFGASMVHRELDIGGDDAASWARVWNEETVVVGFANSIDEPVIVLRHLTAVLR
jgi:hypothetical protein